MDRKEHLKILIYILRETFKSEKPKIFQILDEIEREAEILHCLKEEYVAKRIKKIIFMTQKLSQDFHSYEWIEERIKMAISHDECPYEHNGVNKPIVCEEEFRP